MTQPELAVTALGGITAVGATVAQTCASVRAGLMGFREHPYFVPKTRDPEWDDEEPLLVASVRTLDPDLPGPARLVELAITAIRELVEAGLQRADLDRTALLVALPMRDAATAPWDLAQHFAPALCRRSGLTALRATHAIEAGHTGVLELVAHAQSLIANREVERCILLGVDSLLSRPRLELLDARFRLKSVRAVDGFVPGEAAIALLVEDARRAASRGARAHCVLSGSAVAREPLTESGDRQSTGAGLTAALRGALRSSPPEPGGLRPGDRARWVICDLNGESYRSFEWGVAAAKLDDAFTGLEVLTHPADSFGDIGAASSAAHIAIAAASFDRGYAVAPQATLWSSSDGDARAAAIVRRPTSEN